MPDREPFEIRGDRWHEEPLDYETVIYETDPEFHVATITMNRPERMEALSHQLRPELFHSLKVAELYPDVNEIILNGAGRCFSAGYDLADRNTGVDEPDFGSQYVGTGHPDRKRLNSGL